MPKRHHGDNNNITTTPSKKQKVDYHSDVVRTPTTAVPQAENAETPPQFCLTKDLVDGTVLVDLNLQKWRVGQPIGKGSFGEIFLASDNISRPVTERNAKYVVKIEPHSNGPLFVEIHCLLNAGKTTDAAPLPDGMPEYIASGSHLFRDEKYRFLILPRYKYDLHSILKVHKRLDQKNLLVIACQILDVLQHLHDQGYVHSDIKAQNLMIGSAAEGRRRQVSTGNTPSTSCASSTITTTGSSKASSLRNGSGNSHNGTTVEFSGSNPMRSCRLKSTEGQSLTYHELVLSHYLRPQRNNINYNVDDSDEESLRGMRLRKRENGGGHVGMDMYNSNSNISMCSNSNSSVASSSSSSGISSIANHKGASAMRPRHGKNDTKASKLAMGRRTNGKCGTRKRNVSDSNNDEDGDEEMDEEKTNMRDFGGADFDCAQSDGDRIYLIDFGLASKYVDTNGLHRPFFMDERRAHDGTLEFTSRDAHLGAHARRSDLECLGYNLVYWSQGGLPWKTDKVMQQPDEVHHIKEFFMTNVKEMLKLCYGPQVPKYLGVFLEYVNKLMYNDRPDYDYCRSIFRSEFKRLGYSLETEFYLDVERLKSGDCNSHSKPGGNMRVGRRGVGLNGEHRQQKNKAVALVCTDEVDHKAAKVKTPSLALSSGADQLLVKFGLLVPPIRDTSSSKISPKNLRSKKDSASKKKKRRQQNMSWEELLATDPEQIARQRIEKEFDDQDSNLELNVKYQGKPTYAILEMQSKLNETQQNEEAGVKLGGTGTPLKGSGSDLTSLLSESFLEVSPIKGYTKPMMDIVRRRHSNLMRSLIEDSELGASGNNNNTTRSNSNAGAGHLTGNGKSSNTNHHSGSGLANPIELQSEALLLLSPNARRRKAGLRPHVKPTVKSLFYHKNLLNKKLMETQRANA